MERLGLPSFVEMKVFISVGFLAVLTACGLAACDNNRDVQRVCDERLSDVHQVIVVLTDRMNTTDAVISVYRNGDIDGQKKWQRQGRPFSATIGGAGLGWGVGFEGLQRGEEPIKQEGDKRTPAGVYKIGAPFGLVSSDLPDYIVLKPDQHVCVDDLSSEHYGKIVSRSTAGAETHGEEMAAVAVYKRGLVVDYPKERVQKSGSCIFFHIWTKPGETTSGCVASSEQDIIRLQHEAADRPTAVVLWTGAALERLKGCLPSGLFAAIDADVYTGEVRD